jgi:hypothetical protein
MDALSKYRANEVAAKLYQRNALDAAHASKKLKLDEPPVAKESQQPKDLSDHYFLNLPALTEDEIHSSIGASHLPVLWTYSRRSWTSLSNNELSSNPVPRQSQRIDHRPPISATKTRRLQ